MATYKVLTDHLRLTSVLLLL